MSLRLSKQSRMITVKVIRKIIAWIVRLFRRPGGEYIIKQNPRTYWVRLPDGNHVKKRYPWVAEFRRDREL